MQPALPGIYCNVCGEPLEEGKDYLVIPHYVYTFSGELTVKVTGDEDPKEKALTALKERGLDDLREVMKERDGYTITAMDGGVLDTAKARHKGCLTKAEIREETAKKCRRLDQFTASD